MLVSQVGQQVKSGDADSLLEGLITHSPSTHIGLEQHLMWRTLRVNAKTEGYGVGGGLGLGLCFAPLTGPSQRAEL